MSPLHLKIYRAALYLYPKELRLAFGDDMAEAFEEDLRHSAPIHVWSIALRELLQIGFPGLMRSPAVAVPFLAAAANMAGLTLELTMALLDPKSGITPVQVAVNVMLIGFLTAPVAWVVVHRHKKDQLVSLGLAR